jgi:hypothetical protein
MVRRGKRGKIGGVDKVYSKIENFYKKKNK